MAASKNAPSYTRSLVLPPPPPPALQELRVDVLSCLGNLGAVLLRKNDADAFFDQLFSCLHASRDDETKIYLLDAVTLVLQSFSQRASKYQVLPQFSAPKEISITALVGK